ncbi:DUF2975 domain-containing protein [Providencia sp. SP181]|uniref:DUF2975 domain-containing protein n=1 Tax=Providencia sp. SP181 TaxID=3136277 RepID=UPI003D2AE69C
MRNFSHSHKIQVRLCLTLEATLLFLMFALSVVCAYLLFWSGSNNQFFPQDAKIIEWTSGDSLYFIVDNLVIILVLFQMYLFCRGVRNGNVFTKSRIRNVKCIGLILVIGYIANLYIRTFFDSILDEWNSDYISIISTELYSLQQLLLGAGVFSLSYIFEKGKELKEENELVI